MNPQDDNKKRKANETDSDSTTSVSRRKSQKTRRRSFFLLWDDAVEIPSALKKLKKSRLGVSQDEFSQLEYQLHCIGCVTTKDGKDYTYAARTVDLPSSVYISLQRYIPFYKLLFLCMWRYQNKQETIPSFTLEQLLTEDMSEMDAEDEDGVIRATRIRLNEKHQIQHCMWTVKQRKAVANTRDYFFNDFEREKPMIFDLPLGPSNKQVIRDFLVGMWKAEIDDEIIFYICAELMGLQEIYPRPKPVKLKRRAAVQRKSMTDMRVEDKEIVAAILIQDFYRQRLERKRNAVRVIEKVWEPLRLEGIEARRSLQERFHSMAAENEKDFNWEEFSKEIRQDYSSILQPLEQREISKDDRYWLKVIALVTLPMGIATAVYLLTDLRLVGGIELIVFIIYFLFALLMLFQMGDRFWLYLQTICNLAMLVFLINTTSHSSLFKFTRLYMLVFVVILGGKKWTIAGTVYMIVRNIYSIIQQAKLMHYIISNAFDIYAIITIATASRKGLPIEMLHKLSVNLIVGFFVIGGIAFSVFIGCLTIQEEELPV